jgi:hypothetical protein
MSPQSIHLTHFVIDGRIRGAKRTEPADKLDSMLDPDAIAPTVGMFVATAQRLGWGNGTAALDQNFLVGPVILDEPGVAIAVATLRCGTIMPLAISLLVTFGHFSATNGANDSCMQAMQLLALSGVMAATGAMISLTIAVSPPLTLLPPRSAPAEVNTQQQRTIGSVGAAPTDNLGHRMKSTDDIPPIQPRQTLDGLSGGPQMLPLPQDLPRVTPRRDLLEGLIGGLLFAQDAPQVMQFEQQEPAAPPKQQESAMAMVQEPPAKPSDACARQGLRLIYYTQNNHRYWRCARRR